MAVTSYATVSDTYQLEFEEQGITIVFEENTTFTNEERQYIADTLVYGTTNTDNTTTYAWCWLTGHEYQYEYVYAVEHKASATTPRCLKTTYRVETCTKCDHMEMTEISSTYIICCEEE